MKKLNNKILEVILWISFLNLISIHKPVFSLLNEPVIEFSKDGTEEHGSGGGV